MFVLSSSISAEGAFPGCEKVVGVLRAAHVSMKHDPVIERAQAGDEAAFRELFVTHRETVARIVFRVMGHSPDLEDVIQEVFVHVFRSLKTFRGDSKFSTWLYRLAVNVTRMHLRRSRSRPRFADVPIPENRDSQPGERPDLVAERSERVRALYRLLRALSEKKRMVLILHDFEGLSPKEIAEVVEAPVLTVRTRLFYARKELYAAIAADPGLRPVVEDLLEKLPGKPGAARSDAKSQAGGTR